MLTAGPARKVTIHVSENHKYHGQSAYAAILDFLFYRAVSGATVVRGIAVRRRSPHAHGADRIALRRSPRHHRIR
jgi:PII-like signaling protein